MTAVKTCPICNNNLKFITTNTFECNFNKEDHTYIIDYNGYDSYPQQIVSIKDGYQYQYREDTSGWVFKTNNSVHKYKVGHISLDKDWVKKVEHFIEVKNSQHNPYCICCDKPLNLNQDINNYLINYSCNNFDCKLEYYKLHFIKNSFDFEIFKIKNYIIHNLLDDTSSVIKYAKDNKSYKDIKLSGWITYSENIIEMLDNLFKDNDILK